MTAINIILSSIILSLWVTMLMRQGEILQGLARWVNLNLKPLNRVLTCPYCLGGWISICQILATEPTNLTLWISLPITMVSIFIIVNSFDIWKQ